MAGPSNPMYAGFADGSLALVVTGLGVNLIVPVDAGAAVARRQVYDEPPAPKPAADLITFAKKGGPTLRSV